MLRVIANGDAIMERAIHRRLALRLIWALRMRSAGDNALPLALSTANNIVAVCQNAIHTRLSTKLAELLFALRPSNYFFPAC